MVPVGQGAPINTRFSSPIRRRDHGIPSIEQRHPDTIRKTAVACRAFAGRFTMVFRPSPRLCGGLILPRSSHHACGCSPTPAEDSVPVDPRPWSGADRLSALQRRTSAGMGTRRAGGRMPVQSIAQTERQLLLPEPVCAEQRLREDCGRKLLPIAGAEVEAASDLLFQKVVRGHINLRCVARCPTAVCH